MDRWTKKVVVGALAVGAFVGCSSNDDVRLERIQQPLVYGTNSRVSNSGNMVRQQSEQSLQLVSRGVDKIFLAAYMDGDTGLADKTGLAESSPVNGVSTPNWPTRRVIETTSGSPFTNMFADPWLTASSDGVTVYYSALGNLGSNRQKHRLGIAKSNDGGSTFSGFTGTWAEVPSNCGITTDRDRPTVETSADGQSVWVAYTCETTPKTVRVARSTNGGMNWTDTLVATLTGANRDPVPIIKHGFPGMIGSQTVYVTWQDDTAFDRRIKFARSDDDGATWPMEVDAVPPTPTMDPPFDGNNGIVDYGGHYWFETDPVDYHCLIAYDISGKIYYTSSQNGVVWDPPTDVAIDSGYERFQPILRASPTTLVIAYYVQPIGGAKNTSVWAMASNTQGLQGTWFDANAINGWTPPGRISGCSVAGCSSGTFRTDGFEACVRDPGGERFFGDYIALSPLLAPGQMSTDLSHGFYAVWADSRPDGGGPACPLADQFQAIHQHSVGQLFGAF